MITGAALFALVGGTSARAADLPGTNAPAAPLFSGDPASQWIVTLSVQGYGAPVFPGANRGGLFGAPGVDIRRQGTPQRFSTPDDGFGIALYDSDVFRVGPVGRIVGDRNIKDFRELTGLKSVGWTAELGGFAEVNPLPFLRGRLEVRQGVGGHDGLVATLGSDVWTQWKAFTLSVGPRLNFGDTRYAETYFSVSPTQSVANGVLPPYDARGGLTSAGAFAAARYQLSEAWRTTLFGGYQRLTGSVGASPIPVLAGSRDQYIGGVEVAYSFGFRGF